MSMAEDRLDRRGVWVAIGSYVLWGVMPLYWHALSAVPSMQIIVHRIVWSTLLVCGWLALRYGRGWLRETLALPRAAWMLALSGTLIAFNWSLYIWAVNAGHVVETSLGYFINPLLNVVLGVVVLHGDFPWIALALAASFGAYGLVRKLVGVPPVRGLGVESLYLFLPALAVLLWGEARGQGGFVAHGATVAWGAGVSAMLVLGGALTALPLIGLADAVSRIPY